MQDDATSAFPSGDHRNTEPGRGMSLRDYFAAHAPEPDPGRIATQQGIDRARNPHNDSYKPAMRSDEMIRAQFAYQYADAMLAARKPTT